MRQPFAKNIWIADGPPVVAAAGFHYPIRMTVIRLADGGLFLWSPTPLEARLRASIAALGPVRHIVAPNALHHLHLMDWARSFPEARTYGTAQLAHKAGLARARAVCRPASYVANPMVQPEPLPAWATVDPYKVGISSPPGQGANLVSGEWKSTRLTEEIPDPLTGEPMFLVPDTSRGEVRCGVLVCVRQRRP